VELCLYSSIRLHKGVHKAFLRLKSSGMWQRRVWWMGITVLEECSASSFTLHNKLVDSSKMLLITRCHGVTSHLHCFAKLKSQRLCRHIRTIAKSIYQLCHMCLSVYPPLLGRLALDWFPQNLTNENLFRSFKFSKNQTKIAHTVREDLSMLHCWPQQKFATKAIFMQHSILLYC
jgi:hypothetical protein